MEMKEREFRPYGYLAAFGIAAVVTFFMVPELPFYRRPDLPPWFAVIGAAAVAAVAGVRMAISARGRFRVVGIILGFLGVGWLLYLGHSIMTMW